MVINFNFKDGTETITFADLEKSALGSDLKVSGAPKRGPVHLNGVFEFYNDKNTRPRECGRVNSFYSFHAFERVWRAVMRA